RTALEISEQLDSIGASVGAGSNVDTSTVSLNTLTSELDEALEIYADIILNPSFPQSELDRLLKQRVAQIKREQVTPVQMALRVFPKLLYGEGHAYGLPLTGSGTLESVQKITSESLAKYHQSWFKPGNATLVIVGDTSLEQIQPKLERLFAGWKDGAVPKKNIATVAQKDAETVYIVDRPGSEQSIIFAGHVAPPKANATEFSIEAMNDVLGGDFTARVNMNLREDKHWAYGAYTFMLDAKGQRPFIAYAPVQTDKTAESMAELKMEMTDIIGDRPPEESELARVRNNNTLSLPGRWETGAAVAGSLAEMVRFGLADDYWRTYPDKVRALAVDSVSAAARDVIKPDRLVWVVVGDREKIEPRIRELGYGEIRLIDTEGASVNAN
ncbi:MAG: pitrilysin family protein, partial [Pseudomonadota bacterium]